MTPLLVIFDLDGTLVDSETLCNQAFLDLIPALSDTVDVVVDRYRGIKLADILRDIESRTVVALPKKHGIDAMAGNTFSNMSALPALLQDIASAHAITGRNTPSTVRSP